MTKYFYQLRTGSGSDRIDLEFNGDKAEIKIDTRWMGQGHNRFELVCQHQPVSNSYGLLFVEILRAALGDSTDFIDVAIDPEEVLLPLTIEYLHIEPSTVFVHSESQLTLMQPMGYADWNNTFEIVLMIHDAEWRAESSPLDLVCQVIDKKKFRKVAGEN